MAVYPPGLPNGVEVRGSDLARLDDDEFLNDTVIDLYIRCRHVRRQLLVVYHAMRMLVLLRRVCG